MAYIGFTRFVYNDPKPVKKLVFGLIVAHLLLFVTAWFMIYIFVANMLSFMCLCIVLGLYLTFLPSVYIFFIYGVYMRYRAINAFIR